MRTLRVCLLAGLVHLSCAEGVQAQRPPAPKLLPEKTLATLRIVDTPQLLDRFRQTALGRIGQDEQVKPLVSSLYSGLQEAWKQLEERVGLPLEEVLGIPQGEVCIAFAAQDEQRPGVVVILDVRDRTFQVRKLLERGEALLERRGGSKGTETIAGQEVTAYQSPAGPLYLLEREGTYLLASTKELMQFALDAWEGRVEKTLADSDQYNQIMSRCGVSSMDPPQVTYYVDPIEAIRRLARGSFAATGLALFPVLGLDGIRGVGGSLTFASGEFDQVQHLHILLDNPRAGVLEAVALKSSDTTPESWVPPDCLSYTTLHWDFYQTFRVSARLYNSLMEEGAFQEEVRKRISERTGVDFEKELLPLLDGRVTLAQWTERPVRINSITSIIGLRLKDPAGMTAIIEKLVAKGGDRVEKQHFGNVNYWTVKVPDRRNLEQGPALRQPQPSFAIVGDYLILSDSAKALQEAVLTSNDPSRGLANSLDYKLIASKIKRQPGGEAPGLVQFQRPEEGMRFWYELASADTTRQRLAQRAEQVPFFKSVDQALKDHPLPPFDVLAQYLAPGGGMMVNDETGIHYSSFTLKRE